MDSLQSSFYHHHYITPRTENQQQGNTSLLPRLENLEDAGIFERYAHKITTGKQGSKLVSKNRSGSMMGSHSAEQAARQLWLLYFNRALLERGIITEKEHNKMKVKIQSQSSETN